MSISLAVLLLCISCINDVTATGVTPSTDSTDPLAVRPHQSVLMRVSMYICKRSTVHTVLKLYKVPNVSDTNKMI